jgi:hypothetical protein
MKGGVIALAMAAAVWAATPQSSDARGYRYHYCTFIPHYDYTHSNSLSPMSYIYPAANWGTFFQCHVYLSSVQVVLPTPTPY